MTAPHTLNPMSAVVVPVAVPVAVLVPTPMVARRVRPQGAKPAEARTPTALETVSKMVDNVAQIAGVVGKLLGKPTGPAAAPRAARPAQSGYADQMEMLPDTAFEPAAMGEGAGGDWGGEPLPAMDVPAATDWDWHRMGGFDPNALTVGFDPSQLMGFDPNAGW